MVLYSKAMRLRLACACELACAAVLFALASGSTRAAAQRWAEVFRDEPPYGTERAELGASVAIVDTIGVAGAPTAAGGGHVHVYELTASGWVVSAVPMPTSVSGSDRLGASVSVTLHMATGTSGRIAAGAPGHTGTGTVHVWDRAPGGAWGPPTEVTAPTSFSGFEPLAFGAAVDVSGDYLVVGAPMSRVSGFEARGAIFVFERSGGVWVPRAAWSGDMFIANSRFGQAVSIQAHPDPMRNYVIAVGTPSFADTSAGVIGNVVILSGDLGGGISRDSVVLPAAVAGSELGASVDITPGVAVAGAPGMGTGAAFRFVETTTPRTWMAMRVAGPPASAIGDRFGAGVALGAGGPTWVGAPERAGSVGTAGEVFGFAAPAPVPSPLQPRTVGAEARLGTSVSATANNVIVGAPGQTSPRASAAAVPGAAIIFALVGTPCMRPSDCPGSAFCVDGVCCDTGCRGGDDADCASCATASLTGVCSADPGHVCRPATAMCDPAELCAASGRMCPVDVNMCADFDAGLVDAGELDAVVPELDAGEPPPPPPPPGVSFEGGGGCACGAVGVARARGWLALPLFALVLALGGARSRRRRRRRRR